MSQISYIVVDHIHDAERGVYEMIVAATTTVTVDVERLVAAQDEELPTTVFEPEEVTVVLDQESIIFVDDDPRWFHDERRLPDEEIVQIQRSLVASALAARAAPSAEPATARPMPTDSAPL